MKPMQTIKFVEDVVVLNHLDEIEFSAKAGEVVELSVSSARRWLNRNKAEVYASLSKGNESGVYSNTGSAESEKAEKPVKKKRVPRKKKVTNVK